MRASLTWLFQQLPYPGSAPDKTFGWRPGMAGLDRATFATTIIADRVARMRRPTNDGTIVRMRRLIDKTDQAIGVEGGRVEARLTRLVKRIASRTHTQRRWATPEFGLCLGMAMGAGAFRVYAPKAQAHYIIPRMLSHGDMCCEYSLALVSETAERWKERKG